MRQAVFLFFVASCTSRPVSRYGELSMRNLIQRHGYPYEAHTDVETEDGYLIDIFRIPHGRSQTTTNENPILLMHGLLRSSADYVLLGPETSLGFLLADKGYDVWIGNTRGNFYGRKSVRFDVYDPDFWKFSWHEIGVYDLPAIIDKIRNVTGSPSLSYVGMSQGGTSYFVMAADRPEYNRYVKVMVGLAAAVFQKNVARWLQLIAPAEPLLDIVESLGIQEAPPPEFASYLIGYCTSEEYPDACAIIYNGNLNNNPHLNKTTLRTVSSTTSTVALRQLRHYAQNIRTGEFRHYDFGPTKNVVKYGTTTPPKYDLSKATAPVALYYSVADDLAPEDGALRLCKELPNCVYKYRVPSSDFTHSDFQLGIDATDLVYNDVISVLDQYNGR